jgi:hypothetical protein
VDQNAKVQTSAGRPDEGGEENEDETKGRSGEKLDGMQ